MTDSPSSRLKSRSKDENGLSGGCVSPPYRHVALRREKSLSRGLARTTDSLIILEGDPGSGKSVALRHLAEQLACGARDAKSATSLIPLYVNLKGVSPAQPPG